MSSRVAVVDSGLSNLDSAVRALEEVGGRPYIASSGNELGQPDHIVLPGVGAFPDGMASLHARGFPNALGEQIDGFGVPVLGICLGMQLLATDGSEGGTTTPGLGLVAGHVDRLEPTDADRRIPHVGWNEVVPTGTESAEVLFAGIDPGMDFYFVHSYHLRTDDDEFRAGVTPYCGGFTAAVGSGCVYGVQFHPEKSQAAGFAVLRNFLSL